MTTDYAAIHRNLRTARQMPADDIRAARWKEAGARIDRWITLLIVVATPILIFQLYERI